MNNRDIIKDVLVRLFNEILKLEENAIITGEFQDISVNDMHIIDAIGKGEGKNMSAIAKRMGITVGSLTTSMNSLVKKGYVIRERSEEDRRIVNIRLLEKGERAYDKHSNFHKKMVDSAMDTLNEEEIPIVAKTLAGLNKFFQQFKME